MSGELPVHGRNVGRHRGIILEIPNAVENFEVCFVKIFFISHYIKMSFQLKKLARAGSLQRGTAQLKAEVHPGYRRAPEEALLYVHCKL